MTLSLESSLCVACGLCCKGIFHQRGNIHDENDIRIVKKLDIPMTFDHKVKLYTFPLPCSFLCERKCTIYAEERPSTCSGFSCELLNNLRKNEITLDQAIKSVNQIEIILQKLLPELKLLAKEQNENKPEILMGKVLDCFPNSIPSVSFKKEHSALLIDYAVYLFLKKKFIKNG